jgi:hypothetical protein
MQCRLPELRATKISGLSFLNFVLFLHLHNLGYMITFFILMSILEGSTISMAEHSQRKD